MDDGERVRPAAAARRDRDRGLQAARAQPDAMEVAGSTSCRHRVVDGVQRQVEQAAARQG
jgi:hypothetical protein